MNKKSGLKWIKLLVGVVITMAALYLSFRKLDWQALKETFSQTNIFWVTLALANSIFTVFALGWRWQILLRPERKIPLKSLFRFNIISQYTNILIPARLGEVARVYLVSKQYKVSGAFVAGTIVIEKVFDFLVFVLLWISVPAVFALQKEFRGYKIAILFCFLTVSLLVLFILRPNIFLNGIRFFSRALPKHLRQKTLNFIEKGIEAFALLKNLKTFFIIASLTFLFILCQILTNFFLFKALNLNLSIWIALFVLIALQVGTIPPSAPGKIGIFEYIIILVLTLFGVGKSQALSYGILLHLISFLPKIILGFIFLSTLRPGLKQEMF